ncbi:MAG TPA: hypothetical protein VD994_17735 [Prosthecobacter sp.]|nr:hypothetical protein [Prosthecobacter sp.]
MAQKALDLLEKEEGRESRWFADQLVDFGVCAGMQGDHAASEGAFTEAEAIFATLSDGSPFDLAQVHGNRAAFTAQRGEMESALSLVRRACEEYEAAVGIAHPRTAESYAKNLEWTLALFGSSEVEDLTTLVAAKVRTAREAGLTEYPPPLSDIHRMVVGLTTRWGFHYGSLFLRVGTQAVMQGTVPSGLRILGSGIDLIEESTRALAVLGDPVESRYRARLHELGLPAATAFKVFFELGGPLSMQVVRPYGEAIQVVDDLAILPGGALRPLSGEHFFLYYSILEHPTRKLQELGRAVPELLGVHRCKYLRLLARLAACEGRDRDAVHWATEAASAVNH